MLEWALRYLRLGWPVFPLRPAGKEPLTANGSKDATLNENQVREWWGKWPQANIGLATGHRFFAVDIDLKDGGEDTWDMLRSQYAPYGNTLEAVTGTGGRHILFAIPSDFVVQNSASRLGPGVDVRGQGGYIVAAPSIHPVTRRAYDWDGLAEIEETPIAAAPVWLLRAIREYQEKPAAGGQAAQRLPEKIAEGGRNDTLFRAAAKLRRQGFSEEEMIAALAAINQSRCSPPLPDAELRVIAKSAARYAPEPRADLFGRGSAAKKSDASHASSAGAAAPEGSDEAGLSQADVEAAVADAIARNDLKAVSGLVEPVANLRPSAQAIILAKLEFHFGKEFPKTSFERALREVAKERKVLRFPARAGTSAPEPPEPPDGGGDADAGEQWPDLTHYPLTDSGNGERIVAMFGRDLRWCIEMQKWLVWDGKRWAVDDRNVATQKAKKMARVLYGQAPDSAGALAKWARASESQAAITNALKRAASEMWSWTSEDGEEHRQPVAISARQLDQEVYLLNFQNGVVDLRTGQLLPHDRRFLITKILEHRFDAEAKCPRFLKFLHWAMGQNPESELTERTVRLVRFMQRALGYSLTADVSEKCVFVFYGPKGNNGKTTLLTTFRLLLGEYSAQISIDTIMQQRGSTDAAMRADLADLRGARFVTTSEVEKEHRLGEGKLKYITAGMGSIKSCRKYENPIEFAASHKLFMDCNYRPHVRGSDEAIWRRLKSILFDVSMEVSDPEFDPLLLEKLVAEGPGILAWAVRGAVLWREQGIGNPPEIQQATEEWREHDDPLREFIEDCCEVPKADYDQEERAEFWVAASELGEAYEAWCKKNRERYPLGRESLVERMEARGFRYSRSRRSVATGKQFRSFEGVRLRHDLQPAGGEGG